MKKTFIIGEIGVNHNGDINIAKKLIDLGKKCGVDAVKFQTFKTNKLVCKDAKKAEYQMDSIGKTQAEMLQNYELSYNDFTNLKQYCDYKGIEFISTPFDSESVDFLDSLNVNYFKIGSGDLTNFPLLRKVAQKNKSIILSTGMSTMSEVTNSVNFIYECGFTNKLILLHCVSSYPTNIYDTNLLCINELGKIVNNVGFSDHTEGYMASVIAVACGAKYIEKHYTLDKNMQGPDHKASANEQELHEFVNKIRDTEIMLGNGKKECKESELEIRNIARRSLAFNKNMKKGDIIIWDDLIGLRPNNNICCTEYKKYIGMILKNDVTENEFIS